MGMRLGMNQVTHMGMRLGMRLGMNQVTHMGMRVGMRVGMSPGDPQGNETVRLGNDPE